MNGTKEPLTKGARNTTRAWTESPATGSDEINLQHRELFKRVDGLLAAVDKGTEREETS